MPKKPIIIPMSYDYEITCERCEENGAMDFAGEYLCKQCACNDVFETMNEKED